MREPHNKLYPIISDCEDQPLGDSEGRMVISYLM